MKTKPAVELNLDTRLNLEADRFHALGLEQSRRHLFTPDPLTERLAREHFVRAETYRTAAKLAAS